jgi:enoyl-CoA hydratase/3-hydroxyacyl-CoA dehydrogenase
MLRTGQKLSAADAHELGVVSGLAGSYEELIGLAVRQVRSVPEAFTPTPDGPVDIAAPAAVEPVAANGMQLSGQTVGVIADAVRRCAAAATLAEALEIGYRAFAKTACAEAAREGVTAFLERRAPDFTKTG